MKYAILCVLCTIAALCTQTLARAGKQDICEDVIAEARENILAQKQDITGKKNADDEAIIGAMLRGLGAIYGWTVDEHGAKLCAAAIMEQSSRWKKAVEAVKEHRFIPYLLVLGYPLMWEREHKKLLAAKADAAEAIGRNAVYDFATGNFGNYAVLREWFRQKGA